MPSDIFSAPSQAPDSLAAAIRGPQGGYKLTHGYSLELRHGCMGYFPAVFAGTQVPIVTTSRELITRVWEGLEPRRSKRNCNLFYVNEFFGYGYPIPTDCSAAEETKPIKILTEDEYTKLTSGGAKSFEWMLGLASLLDISQEQFLAEIKQAA